MPTSKLKFYTFTQNNSGGSFVLDKEKGLTQYVIIQADGTEEANSRAENAGIYFDGVDNRLDCHCCGDRWHRAEYDGGKNSPLIYGESPQEFVKQKNFFQQKDTVAIHYYDGRIEFINKMADFACIE